MAQNKRSWRSYAFEFFSIFIAVVSAFALNNWNENRRDRRAETSILQEISNGLAKDLDDIKDNTNGHKAGMESCAFWNRKLNGDTSGTDSVVQQWLNLTRDFVSIQNRSGYESLKSKGLELVQNDSLRYNIISLYEYDYNTLLKLEEQYQEAQFHKSYFPRINAIIGPHLIFDNQGQIRGLNMPLELSDEERNEVRSYLWKIASNRYFISGFYARIDEKVRDLRAQIQQELDD